MDLTGVFLVVLVVALGLQGRDLLNARYPREERLSTLVWLLASVAAGGTALWGGVLGGSLAVGSLLVGFVAGWRLRWSGWARRRTFLLPDPDAPDAEASRVLRDRLDELPSWYDSRDMANAVAVGLAGGLVTLFGLAYLAPVPLLIGAASLVYPVQRLLRLAVDWEESKAIRQRLLALGASAPSRTGRTLAETVGRAGDARGVVGPEPLRQETVLLHEAGARLLWQRVGPYARRSELQVDGKVVGELGPAIRSGHDAWGECFGEEWDIRIERPFFGLGVDAALSRGDLVGARYEGMSVKSGRFIIEDRELRWRRRIPGSGHQEIVGDGHVLVGFRPTFFSFGRVRTRVEIAPQVRARAELPRLLLLGWFLKLYGHSSGRGFRRVR